MILGATSSVAAVMLSLGLQTGVSGQSVSVATDLGSWSAWPMQEVSPGKYDIQFEQPWLHEIQYKFVVGGQWLADPNNPNTADDGHGGLNSVIEITGFHEDPWLQLQPGVAPLPQKTIQLTDLEGSPRAVTVVGGAPGSVTVYFQDGGDYLAQAGAAELLANLSQQPDMPAMTGVFIPPKDRMREYELLPAYADFVTSVVVPAVESGFPGTGGSSSRRLLIGSSLGGLITLYTALRHPDVFAWAASQSGSLWFNNGDLVNQLGQGTLRPLKLFMDCGTYETSDMLSFNRQGETAARKAGHTVRYREYPSTHDWIGWRNRLRETFRYFFGGSRRAAHAG